MKKQFLFSFALLLSAATISAQNVSLEWAVSMGGLTNDDGRSIATDPNGNVYTTGWFYDSVDFDPGVDTFNLISPGGGCAFIQNLDPSGNLLWARSMCGSVKGLSIATDASGNVYSTGWFAGIVDFDPDTSTYNLTSAGNSDIFIQKLDPSGNLIWAKSMGGTDGDNGSSINIDISGNIYTTGWFHSTVDFDPGVDTLYLTSVINSKDIFIQKLDPNGNFLWAKSMGGISYDEGSSITTDASGNVYTTGTFHGGIVDFDPGAGTFNLIPAGGTDIFIQKLDPNGNFLWAKSMGGISPDEGSSITTDTIGNIYITGSFHRTVDFDPGLDTLNLTSVINSEDIFIQKLDPNGNLLWAKSIGGPAGDYGSSISTDTSCNVYTTGWFSGTVDFDPGLDTLNLTSVNNFYSNIFIQKLDPSGNLIWAKSMGGGTYGDKGRSITTDASCNVYTTGNFQGSADFDPSANIFNLTSVGYTDIFIQKLKPCFDSYSTDSVTSCNNYTSPSGMITWDSTGTYVDNIPNVAGCDSIITINLTINNSSNATDSHTACDSYTWIDGNTYTSNNNTATHTLTNVAGCDSVITLNLTLNNSNTATDTQAACDSYIWIDGNTYTSSNNTATHTLTNVAGCDSVVTLNLTINSSNTGTDTQTACDSYTWIDGNTYTNNNSTATHTLTNVAGCDSVVTLDLTINTVDNQVTNNLPTLTANATGATYQWLDCDNNYVPISGETNQSFTATSNGNYAVEVTQNNCTDTSDCELVTVIGLQENRDKDIHIHPNPTTGILTIEGADGIASVYDIYGRLVLTSNTNTLDISNTTMGIYFVRVLDEQGMVYVGKVLKE